MSWRRNIPPGIKRNHQLNGGAPKGWTEVHPRAIEIERLPAYPPVLYAIISSWNDEDVIGATVTNCFRQGCSKVFLLDNASSDSTVDIAEAAGADVAMIYETQMYDDDLRITLQNKFMHEQWQESGFNELWWLALDSDEFPSGIHGEKVLDVITGLPESIRIVGTDFIDLYPTSPDQYVANHHPAKCMDSGIWRRGGVHRYCECGHWKHNLIRFIDGELDFHMARGNHTISLENPDNRNRICEPHFDIVTFHAPIRGREATEKRLRALCSGRSQWDDQVTRGQGAIKRWQTLDDVYSGRWDRVEIPHSQQFGRRVVGVALYKWRSLLRGFDESIWAMP